MNHEVGRWVFALGVGVLVAFFSYRWITDTQPREERELEDAAVSNARTHLVHHVGSGIEFVDPWSPNRKVGKSYVFRADGGWEVSGYYRRGGQEQWYPFLVTLDEAYSLVRLRVQDPALAGSDDPLIEVLP